MEINIPEKIERLTHGGVVKALLKVNRNFKVPSRTEWPKHVPDLVHKTKRVTVEVEMSNLETGWGQCMSYYRLGSEGVHLILPPRLFRQYRQDERNYVVKNPIPNIEVHQLPVVEKRRGRPPKKKTIRKDVAVTDPAEKFYHKTPKPFTRMKPWKDEYQETTPRQKLSTKGLGIKSGNKRVIPKATQSLLPKSTKPCKYCHHFNYKDSTYKYCLACARKVSHTSLHKHYK